MSSEQCFQCKKQVDLENDKYTLVATYNIGKNRDKKEEVYFHFQCWIEHFNQAIIKRISHGQEQAMKMLSGALKNANINISND